VFFICVPKNYNIIYEDAANSQVVKEQGKEERTERMVLGRESDECF
jgi:hypothetical protein